MEDLVEKWRPVLKKCEEIPQEDWLKAAKEMEIRLPCGDLTVKQILYFTMTMLPEIRRPWLIRAAQPRL